MFQQFKNIDSAFRFVRGFALVFIISTTAVCLYVVHRYTQVLQKGQGRIYVLAAGKLLPAESADRRESLAVEARDHIKMFHIYFYGLQPDEEVNTRHINAALNLADSTAYQEYKDLQERGYYAQIISGNITEEVLEYDSIRVDVNHPPFYFRYYGKLRMARATSLLTRSLVTEGYLRDLGTSGICDKNPHGFLIEHWKVLDNHDLSLERR